MKIKNKWYYLIFLSVAVVISLYIRIILPWHSFSNIGCLNGNDPYYNFHLTEITLHNFPHRPFFDVFTGYPSGTVVPFAFLFDFSVSTILWVIGLGSPYQTLGEQCILTIFAIYPAILGTLVVVPVYLIGKEIWNENAGIISALVIAVLPGQFLSRSVLGFTDHHVAEVLFSTILMLCFIKSLKIAKESKITFKSSWSELKMPLKYSLLTGVALGLFFLVWSGGPLFLFILFIYLVIQFIITYLKGESVDYLSISFFPSLLVCLIMILPLFFTPFVGFVKIQIISIVLVAFACTFLQLLSTILNASNKDTYLYPIVILTTAILSYIILSIIAPDFLHMVLVRLNVFFPKGGQLTIAEVSSMRLDHIFSWFSTTFFVAIVGFALLLWNIINSHRDEEILTFVWCFLILLFCFGQNRFAYYYAVNVALLCGLVSWKLIEYIGFSEEKDKPRVKGSYKKNKKKIEKKPIHKNYSVIFACVVIFVVVILPPLSISVQVGQQTGGIPHEWYDAMIWLKDNTPETGLDYYKIYDQEGFVYPESAYSIMSWWDYGHWITTIAHRIPFANPFQQGAHEAAEYLISVDEDEANKILDNVSAKYVIIDYPMADYMGCPTNPNPKYVMPVWTGKNPNPLHTVMGRLFYFDGSEVESENIEALEHYRLVYESSTYVLPFQIVDVNTNQFLGWQAYHGSYEGIIHDLDLIREGALIDQNRAIKTPEYFSPTGFVKIFEYVPDPFVIMGEVKNGSKVSISVNVSINQRTFVYSQSSISDDDGYRFLVPYSGNYTISVFDAESEMFLYKEYKYIK